jgi:hypothetical protein
MLQWMQACYCGMASAIIEISAQSSIVTQQGQNLKLKGCYCFQKKIGGVEHNKVPERPFASEVKCCRWTLYLIMPHIIQLDSSTLALVDKNDVSDCIETNSEIGVDWFSSVRAVGKMTLAKALLKRRRQAQYCGHCQNKWLFFDDCFVDA